MQKNNIVLIVSVVIILLAIGWFVVFRHPSGPATQATLAPATQPSSASSTASAAVFVQQSPTASVPAASSSAPAHTPTPNPISNMNPIQGVYKNPF